MSFMYPLCLLALLGIPAIILIYIIKSQYTEQTVNSTYIWTLSEKFLKRRNPLSGLTGIIALILQLLMIILITLALIHPMIILKNKASEYCFILDASESMNMEADGESRFERGKDEIEKIISGSKKGSRYTLVYATDEATTVFEDLEDKKNALKLLHELEPSYVDSNLVDAMGIAQGYFNESPGIESYLITDKTYRMHQNIEIINVSTSENNCGIKDITAEVKTGIDGTASIYVSGVLNSYKRQETLKVALYINGEDTPSSRVTNVVNMGVDCQFSFPPIKLDTPTYSEVRVVIENEDALADDNEAIFYNIKNEKQYKTIIVSDTPFFFQASIDSVGDYEVIAVTPEEYEKSHESKSYGLYIFDSYTPSELPKSGSVWMINSKKSLENTGFNYRSDAILDEPVRLEKSSSSQSTVRSLLDGVITSDIYTIKYLRYSTYGDYMTLFSANGVPLIMAGENSYGNRMVVFAFSLHDSNLALTGDFVNLVDNLLAYSFPSVLDSTSYTAGEEITINTVANCESLKVISPLGEEKYLDTSRTMNTIMLSEVGTYTVLVNAGGTIREHKLFSQAMIEERAPSVVETNFSIVGQPSKNKLDAQLDPSIIIFILIVLIFAADWMVYMYEKRQLR